MKNKKIILFSFVVAFLFMTNLKASTWYNPQKIECTKEDFYYPCKNCTKEEKKYACKKESCGDAKDKDACVAKCIGINESLDRTDLDYNIRVSNICKYSVDYKDASGNISTKQVFCLQGHVTFHTGSEYTFKESTTDTNKGLACGIVDIYHKYKDTDKLKWNKESDNIYTLDVNSFMNTGLSDIKEMQKLIWSHQAESSTCANKLSDTIVEDEDSNMTFSIDEFKYDKTNKLYYAKVNVSAPSEDDYVSLSVDNNKSFIFSGTDYDVVRDELDTLRGNTTIGKDSVYEDLNIIVLEEDLVEDMSIAVTYKANVYKDSTVNLTASFTRLHSDDTQDVGIPSLKKEISKNYEEKTLTDKVIINAPEEEVIPEVPHEDVEVPITGKKTIILSIIGLLLVVFGAYFSYKKIKNSNNK